MDACSLMYDFEGTAQGISVGDFEGWLISHCSRLEVRQLLSEFIVSQSLGFNCPIPVVASTAAHSLNLAWPEGKMILCDFPSTSLQDSLHLDRWNFFLVEGSETVGEISVEDLIAIDPPKADYYTIYKLLQL